MRMLVAGLTDFNPVPMLSFIPETERFVGDQVRPKEFTKILAFTGTGNAVLLKQNFAA